MKFPLESQNEIAFDGFSAPVAVFSRRKPSRTCLADIEQYFHQPPPQFLDLELAVCWVLECLLKDDNYPSGLLQKLMREEPQLRLSETVLQQALDFLEQQGSISTYTQRCPSRGRPRRMLHLMPEARHQAEQLMSPWHSWLDSHRLVLN
jgi:DNA-binding PadR family transcriptional regulator